MRIAMVKPDNDYFVLKEIDEPLLNGWRVSPCGSVAISLAIHYYCDGIRIIETPVEISEHLQYQLFGCVNDTYVYFENVGICEGDVHHTLRLGVDDLAAIPCNMIKTIINNLNVEVVV